MLGNSGCTITNSSNNLIGTSSIPIDPYLDTLQDNGGPTETHHLLSDSPAIDAGNPAAPGSGSDACQTLDQRGIARPQEGDGAASAVCDMGAYELETGVFISSGSQQSARILTSFSSPLAVLLLDGAGQPVQGEVVTFTAPASGASGTFSDSGTNVTTATTNASGIATSAAYSANAVEGSYYVIATGTSTAGQAELSATNFDYLDADLSTHNVDNGSTLPGTFLCDETQPDCTSGLVPDADAAHDYANDTYLFYLNHFGRDSIDGAGMQIVSSVLYDDDPSDGTPFTNAFWSGSLQQMVYGNGGNFAQADDVVGHELTHGVTDFESNLFYYYQSGAINEALSDIFGEFVDLTNGKGDDSAGVRWLIGEDGTLLRDMQDPPVYLDPDKVSSNHYYEGDADSGFFGDNGGVHTNSGVVNKAAYLLTDGDYFNFHTVNGLGIDKVAAIFYEAQTNLLTTASDFNDLYFILPQACTNLIGGAEGITAGDCSEVQNAVDAVELNLQPATDYNPHAEICPQGESVNDLFTDDFESGLGNWTASWLGGSPVSGAVAADYWSSQTVFAAEGTSSLWGNDFTYFDGSLPTDDDSDDYVFAMNSNVSLPVLQTAYLHFEHSFGFENDNWDGGWVEYSTNNGSSWTDIGSMHNDGLAYTGTISAAGDNLNPNHQAYVGDSHGYVSTRFSLDTLKDEDIRIRLRISKDSIGYDLGWFVDNLRIYTCGDPPAHPEPQTPTGTINIPDPDFVWTEGEVGATGFYVQIQDAQDNDLHNAYHQNNGGLCVAGSCTLDPGLILANGDYKWRVRAWNIGYTTAPWSSYMNFTVDVPLPMLIDPVASGNPYGTTPTFSWGRLVGEAWYQLYVWDSSLNPVIDGTWQDANVVCSGSTCTVDPGLTFAEDSYTWDVVTWSITYDYPGESFVVSLGPPEMAVEYNSTEIVDGDTTPDSGDGTDFGSVDVSSGMVTRSFDISNSGTGILSLNGTPIVDISGCSDFTVSTQPANSVTASGSEAFELTFDPSGVGACTATVSIANNDSDENPYTFDVTGTGTVAPEMVVEYNSTEIADGDTTPDSGDGTDFGGVDINSGASARSFTIVNSGGAVLNLTGTPDV
ncbi:MAG: choice-of-anchor D domain-containing protein, partial [Chloroflexi bacterium]|nr:choice-of-anchor D domain-containing protein [Chloroflexota bacterium]